MSLFGFPFGRRPLRRSELCQPHDIQQYMSREIRRTHVNFTVKIKRETDLSDSWRSNISAIFSDKSDKSVSFFFRRIHVNLT